MTSELFVKIIPNSSENCVVGYENHLLKIRIKAVAEKGKANEELVKFLAKALRIPKSAIIIKRGKTSRQKKLEIQNITAKELDLRIDNLLL